MKNFFNEYTSNLKKSIDHLDQNVLLRIIKIIQDVKKNKRCVYLIGNGGSAATPSHSAGDWTKELKIKTIALTDNASSVTAFGNDTSYSNIFKGQLETFLEKEDILIGYSGSGNSSNVIEAIKYAKEIGATTIGITGKYKNGKGGKLAQIADYVICVESNSMEIIEDVHLIINHMIKENIKEYQKQTLK
jgi:D-sedoheptulose 7-phosphate isomerase